MGRLEGQYTGARARPAVTSALPGQTAAAAAASGHALGGGDEGGRRGAGHAAAHEAGQARLLVQLGGQHLGRSLYELRGGRGTGGRRQRGLARGGAAGLPTLAHGGRPRCNGRGAAIVRCRSGRRGPCVPIERVGGCRAAALETHRARLLRRHVPSTAGGREAGRGCWRPGRPPMEALRNGGGDCPPKALGALLQTAWAVQRGPQPPAAAHKLPRHDQASVAPPRLPCFSEAADLLPALSVRRGRRPMAAGLRV